MSRRALLAAATVAATITMAVTMAGSATGAKVQQVAFTTPGSYSWTVPTGVRAVSVEVRGAAGGNTIGTAGGMGGQTAAKFAVVPAQKLQVVVGGKGGNGEFQGSGGTGGFNGGGNGTGFGPLPDAGAGGGGASDIRVDAIGGPCAASLTCPLSARVVVAGGGGGAGPSESSSLVGFGGGFAGTVGGPAGVPGTQDGGGSFGTGGTGTCATCSTGGGGGGWFGGSDGDGNLNSGPGHTGGGGSGYVNPLALSGSSTIGTVDGITGSFADGLVIIRW